MSFLYLLWPSFCVGGRDRERERACNVSTELSVCHFIQDRCFYLLSTGIMHVMEIDVSFDTDRKLKPIPESCFLWNILTVIGYVCIYFLTYFLSFSIFHLITSLHLEHFKKNIFYIFSFFSFYALCIRFI